MNDYRKEFEKKYSGSLLVLLNDYKLKKLTTNKYKFLKEELYSKFLELKHGQDRDNIIKWIDEKIEFISKRCNLKNNIDAINDVWVICHNNLIDLKSKIQKLKENQ